MLCAEPESEVKSQLSSQGVLSIQVCSASRRPVSCESKSLRLAPFNSNSRGRISSPVQNRESVACLATGGADKPPSGGGPPGKPPGGPEDSSGAGDHDPDDDEVVHLEEVGHRLYRSYMIHFWVRVDYCMRDVQVIMSWHVVVDMDASCACFPSSHPPQPYRSYATSRLCNALYWLGAVNSKGIQTSVLHYPPNKASPACM